MNIACIPIPAEHLPGYLAIQPLFQEGRIIDGNMALNAWNDSMEATTDSFARIERQLFLLNQNVERLLNAQLSRVSFHLWMFVTRFSNLTSVERSTCATL